MFYEDPPEGKSLNKANRIISVIWREKQDLYWGKCIWAMLAIISWSLLFYHSKLFQAYLDGLLDRT